MTTRLVGTALLALLVWSPPGIAAQAPRAAGDDEREQKFIEALQREDPSSAERYVTLRDARARAVADLQRVEAQYQAAGPELRSSFLPQIRRAQRRYAESSLGLLEFLDARDRRALAAYQAEIGRLQQVLEEHERMRAEFGKLLRDN